jgi:HEAT repeat protein
LVEATPRVGGREPAGATDLGTASAAAAVDYLLGPAVADAGRRAAGSMVFAATLAAGESWPGLLRLARDRGLATNARTSAIFWLAHAAGEKATEGLVSLVDADSDELEVRRAAVFALSQVKGDASLDALMEIARTHSEPEIRKHAMFWLGQSKSPRALAFFEDILRG